MIPHRLRFDVGESAFEMIADGRDLVDVGGRGSILFGGMKRD